MTREEMKVYVAAHAFVFRSKHATKIAAILGISPTSLHTLVDTPVWSEALSFWGADDANEKPVGYRHYQLKKGLSKADAGASLSREEKRSLKAELYISQNGNCNGCQLWLPLRLHTLDHITPRSLGGANVPENFQLLCGACNCTKASKTQAELIETLIERGVLKS